MKEFEPIKLPSDVCGVLGLAQELEILMHPNDTTNDIPYGYCHCGCGQKTPIAPKSDKRFGHVKGQPKPFVNNGHKQKTTKQSREEYFFSRISKDEETGCWNWTAGIDGSGYGLMASGSAVDGTQATIKAHRFSYELHKGPIADGFQACHTCDNRRCANPDHMWLGTSAENMQDMHRKGRANHSTRPRGENQSKAKLTESQVLEIRRRHSEGEQGAKLAREYYVKKEAIYKIVNRQTWKHV